MFIDNVRRKFWVQYQMYDNWHIKKLSPELVWRDQVIYILDTKTSIHTIFIHFLRLDIVPASYINIPILIKVHKVDYL